VRFQTAEFDAGAAEGFAWGEAGALEVFGAELDVGAELGRDAGLDFVAGEEGVQVGARSWDFMVGTPLCRSSEISNGLKQATTNAGILHCVQDDY